MNVRNPVYNSIGTVDVEIEHPKFGWIPFTASPDDTEQHGRDIYAAAIAGEYGAIAAYTGPSPLEIARNTASMTRLEFMLALDGAGLYDAAAAYVEDPGTPRRIKIMWAEASSFDRMHPDLITAMQAMGVTDAQADALYGITP